MNNQIPPFPTTHYSFELLPNVVANQFQEENFSDGLQLLIAEVEKGNLPAERLRADHDGQVCEFLRSANSQAEILTTLAATKPELIYQWDGPARMS